MSLGEFERLLRRELRIRPPSWPVYVDGDPDLEWGEVVRAIDVIRGSHGEVVILPVKAPRLESKDNRRKR
jgi:biopolymer transport protein ExbD